MRRFSVLLAALLSLVAPVAQAQGKNTHATLLDITFTPETHSKEAVLPSEESPGDAADSKDTAAGGPEIAHLPGRHER